jgi:hypothetical protein
MELEQRAIIKCLHFQKTKVADIHRELILCFADDACIPASVKHWIHDFQIGRVATEDEP